MKDDEFNLLLGVAIGLTLAALLAEIAQRWRAIAEKVPPVRVVIMEAPEGWNEAK